MSANAFAPQPTNSAALSVTATSTTTPIQVKGALNNGSQKMFYNAGPNDCWIAWGKTAPTAVIPTAGSPANGIAVPAGAIVIYSIPPDAFIAAISKSTETATLYVTAGEGV